MIPANDRGNDHAITLRRGFLPNLPGNSRLATAADCGTLGKRPGHSHSIISWPRNLLIHGNIPEGAIHNTVRNTNSQFRFVAIVNDRCRILMSVLHARQSSSS